MLHPHIGSGEEHRHSNRRQPHALNGHRTIHTAQQQSKCHAVAYPLRYPDAVLMVNLHQQLAAARERLARIERAHPDAYLAAVVFVVTTTLLVVAGSTWLVYDVFHD